MKEKNTFKFKTGIVLLVIISIFAFPFIFWNFSFGIVAGWFLLLTFAGGWYLFIKKKKLRIIAISILAGFIGYMVFLPLTTATINKKQKIYYAKLKKTKKLNTLEMWNLYGLHIAIIAGGIPVSPQASYEMVFVHFPDKDKKRVFYSDFFLQSKKLQKAMAKSDKGHLAWKPEDYYLSNPEHKVALALNPLDYEVRRYKDRIEYYMTVPMHWHYGVDVLLEKPVRFEINESLFRYLEEQKWLHMYWATWRHTEYLDKN